VRPLRPDRVVAGSGVDVVIVGVVVESVVARVADQRVGVVATM